MKVISDKTTAQGKRRVVVELEPGEEMIAVRPDAYYRLGYPVEDIVAAHVLAETCMVTWCSASQGWVK